MLERPSPLRVLVVEDSHDDTLLVVDYLEENGLKIQWQRVESEAALQQALQLSWHLILSDYSIPGFSGKRALEITRDQNPDIPFVFVSGTLGETAAVESIKAGANDYVMKGDLTRLVPIVDRELRDSISRIEQRRQKQNIQKLSLVVEQTSDSVLITDVNGRIEFVNPAFEKLTGYTAEDVLSKNLDTLGSHFLEVENLQQILQNLNQHTSFSGVLVKIKKTGERYFEDSVISTLKGEDQKSTHFVFTGRDITSRIRAEESSRRLATILEATPDLVAMMKPNGDLVYINGAGKKLLGVTDDSYKDKSLKQIFPEPVVKKFMLEALPGALREGDWFGDVDVPNMEGGVVPMSFVVLEHHSESTSSKFVSMIARDLSERKNLESQLQYRATHDALTDLPNRYLFSDLLTSSITRAFRHKNNSAVLFLDVDHFKRVNDTLGHVAGDQLLIEIAQRLKQTLRPTDTVCRHGVDEFALIIEEISEPNKILAVIKKIQQAFDAPILIEEHEIFVAFSLGVAIFPLDGDNVQDLLRRADSAMFQAKTDGGSTHRFFSPEMDSLSHEVLSMEAELRHALENDEFVLHYQPQISLKLGQLVGFEALIRWQHPVKGLLSPNEFMGIVESSGLIHQVGKKVLQLACKEHKRIRRAGKPQVRMSVNVSPQQFSNKDFLENVKAILREECMPAELLELEITENILMRDPVISAGILNDFKSLGVRIAIDDFGTGYSSLSYLKNFPVDVVKIDRSFVRDIGKEGGDEAIVEASISMAKKLGLEIVAEGVETAVQMMFLQRNNCDLIQGYIMSRPAPSHKVEKLLFKTWF
ncbi:Phytochrome-like protein cph2 [Thalassocella blandensis]|nr:Phytochrome-like protein cph2 [Thalassocella blandensis]